MKSKTEKIKEEISKIMDSKVINFSMDVDIGDLTSGSKIVGYEIKFDVEKKLHKVVNKSCKIGI